MTRDEAPRQEVGKAAAVLKAGGLVAFPTETVYGLGAAATNDQAIAAIFEVKARPRFNPLIVHVLDRHAAQALAVWSDLADQLVAHFWPGPLTLIMRKTPNSGLSPLVSAGGETVALRAPSHGLARELLAATGLPIAAPSANQSGKISPTTADHVRQSLGERVDMILDGGACPVGVESTVLDISGEHLALLRPGGLPRSAIEEIIGETLSGEPPNPSSNASSANAPSSKGVLRSPGQLQSHYAPRHRLRLSARDVAPDEALLAFGPEPPEGAMITLNLSEKGDLREAAANLFSMLHRLDDQDIAGIAAMPVPEIGLGEAICDRLRRAATR